LPYDEKLLISCEFNHEKTIRQVLELLNSSDPPDALFACSDRLAMSAMVAAKQKGLSIPNQLAIVGFNNEPVSSLLYPALSSVYQPTFEMGKAAASLLIEEIKQGEQFTPKTKVFKTKLFKRASSNIIS
jgi:LacI family transcriptional regulator